MALPSPVAGDIVASAHIRSIKDHLEGASGSTAPWHFRQSSGNHIVTLSTNDGTTKVSVRDTDGVEVFAVDSNGNITFSGAITLSTLTLPTAASPTQTTEAVTVWDTDDDALTVGDGTSRRRFDSDNKGSDLASGATLTLGNDKAYHVTGTTTITAISTKLSGYVVYLTFDSTVLLTHNATTLILRDGLSRTTVANETVVFQSEGSGNWREIAPPANTIQGLLRSFVDNGTFQTWWAVTDLANFSTTTATLVGVGCYTVLDAAGSMAHNTTSGLTDTTTGGTNGNDAGIGGVACPANRGFVASATLIATSAASQNVIMGMATSAAAQFADANNVVGIRVNGTGNYFGVSDSGGTETTRDTSVLPDGSTKQRFTVRKASNSLVQFFRNNSQIGADVTTNIPTTLMFAVCGIETLTNATKVFAFGDFQGAVNYS